MTTFAAVLISALSVGGSLVMLLKIVLLQQELKSQRQIAGFSRKCHQLTSDLLGVTVRALASSRLENLSLKHEIAEADIQLSRYKRQEQERTEAAARN